MREGTTIHSLARGLKLMDFIADQPQGVTVKWLSSVSNIPLSTCYHLIKTLQNAEYIEKNPETQAYTLSSKIHYLHNQMQEAHPVPQSVKRIVHEVVDRLQETTYIAKWEGAEIVLRHIQEGNQAVKVRALYVGYRDHAFLHALGKAVLAHLPAQQVAAYRRYHPVTALTPFSQVDVQSINRELARTRQSGYSLDVQEWETSVCCVGVPLFSFDEQIWGSLAISLPKSRFDQMGLETYQYLIDVGRRISWQLGSDRGRAEFSGPPHVNFATSGAQAAVFPPKGGI